MFEVQKRTPSDEDWAFRASYDSGATAELRAQTAAHLNRAIHRVVEQPTGRVVAVFAPSGKRLTFPIATSVAYAGLAATAKREGYAQGLEDGRPSWI